jgi:multiple sugar transport system substrate-binding protein
MAMTTNHGPRTIDRRRFLTSSLAAAGGLATGTGLAGRALAASRGPEAWRAKVNLLYWDYIGLFDPTEVTAIHSHFQALYPSVSVTAQSVPWNQYWQKLGATLTAGGPPDVWNTAPTFYYQYINRGQLLNLDPYIKSDYDLKDVFSNTLYMWQSPPGSGPYYGIPRDWVCSALFYRPDMFHKAGIKPPDESWTMDTLLQVAKELTLWKKGAPTADQWGYTTGFGSNVSFDPHVYANGGRVLSPDRSKCLLDQPEAIATLQWQVDMIHKHKVAPSPATYQNQPDPFISGKAAMTINGSWMTVSLNPVKRYPWDVMMMPKGTMSRKVYLGPDGIVISQKTQHPNEAWKLAKFVASSEIGLEWYLATGLVPTSKKLANSATFLKSYKGTGPGGYKELFRSEPFGYGSDYTPGYGEWQTAKINALALAFLGQSSAADAAKKATQAVNEVLQRNAF